MTAVIAETSILILQSVEMDAVERYDTSSLNGGLQVAVRVLEELIGVDQNESVRKIVEQLQKDLSD